MLKQAYEAGVRRAMIDAGLLKESAGTMDPTVQQGIQANRQASMAEGNRYAAGYSPNVPMNNTESALAASAPAATGGGYSGAVGTSGKGYIDAANKPFTGVGGKPGLPPLGHNS